ncbi:tuberin isoform X2 [Magallana gigas]|uniref:tuberin isoform X2 n=1 Tax=Magallana gigas TaxID=29159 RepID=UPI00333E6508
MAKEENFKSKLKNLFGIKERTNAASFHRPQTKELLFTPEILKDIGPESPANNRLKTIRELCDIVQQKKLEENAIEALWFSVKDLLDQSVKAENRHTALHFIQCLVEGQLQYLGILRAHFFRVVRQLNVPCDLPYRIALFKVLSENGKNLQEFEESAGPFLLEWMPSVVNTEKLGEFLKLLVHVIKYNAAYLDEEVVAGLVKNTCVLLNRRRPEEDVTLCLDVLDVVLCYSYLPTECLVSFISALCHTVNISKFSEASWELMRKLLGTHLGHSSIYNMCCMMQDVKNVQDQELLRGVVYFVGMALWGYRKVPTLRHTFSSVLPSFLQVLHTNSFIVAHEVVLNIQRLVRKYGKDLQLVTWHIVLDILERLLKLTENPTFAQPSYDPRLQADLHDILTNIEQLHAQGQFSGCITRFFKIIEMCANKRPESSVTLLIEHQAQQINPSKENWVTHLHQLLEKYFKNETRTQIRVKALDKLNLVLSINKHIHEDVLINRVVLPHLCHIEADPDPQVRKVAADMLLLLANGCTPSCFVEIMAIIEKLINRPLSAHLASPYPKVEGSEVIHQLEEHQLEDVKTAMLGLVELFKQKLYTDPPSHCLKIYDLLLLHMKHQYTEPKNFMSHTAVQIRKNVVEVLLYMRADNLYRLGFIDKNVDAHLAFSPYLSCAEVQPNFSEMEEEENNSITTDTVAFMWSESAYLDYKKSFSLFLSCLENDKDWEVLERVLVNLPLLLQNKTLILSANHDLINSLCHQLCAMVNDRQLNFPEKLHGTPSGKFTRSDFHTFVFPVLASMVSYHKYLDRNRAMEMIKCLEFGLVSKCAKTCTNSLRICTLEMQDVMMRLLPSVLLQLSRISATVHMAIPVLAFLSSIVRLPRMYANFVEEEYRSVFAIALPYTNPFKFSHYTVSLAHHVIAIWFMRCRLPFRKSFVKFIQKGLQANIIQQFEENAIIHQQQQQQNQNQDSSDRSRSSSFNEAAYRNRKRMYSGSAISRQNYQAPVDNKLSQYHHELTETCLDVMSRYTYGNYSAIPARSPVAEFLLANGQSQTWLLGNKVVTITTSGGGGNKSNNAGLCDKCLALYQNNGEPPEPKPAPPSTSTRRRHKSAFVTRSASTIESKASTDDIGIQPRMSFDDMMNSPGSTPEHEVAQVGVQTGSSLSDHTPTKLGLETEAMEAFLIGIQKKHTSDGRVFQNNTCSCWCTVWAEIFIRGPSGNVAWMMRIENDPSHTSMQESQAPDITMLFASVQKKEPDLESLHSRIESGSIGEAEYESLYDQHFPSDHSQDGDLCSTNSIRISIEDDSDDGHAKRMTQLSEDEKKREESDPNGLAIPPPSISKEQLKFTSLQRSNSSPSLLSSSGENLDPRDSQSEIVMIDNLQIAERKGEITQDKPETSMLSSKLQHPQDLPLQTDHSHPTQNQIVSPASPSPSSESSSLHDEVKELPDFRKVRGHTISVVQSARDGLKSGGSGGKELGKGGINPSFVFLQLYYDGVFSSATNNSTSPLVIPQNDTTTRALKMLDHIHPYETHKIGVIYVGPRQTKDEKGILSNQYGSERYAAFVQGLGQLLRLSDCNPDRVYIGGLDCQGKDGQFAYSWQDESMHVIFHVATLMPNRDSDPNCNAKKLHIGNDYVTIVYNDSNEDYRIGIIKGQFNYVNIVIRPLDHESNAVTLQAKEVPFKDSITTDIADILGHKDTKVISDDNLAALVRQIAVNCDLASLVLQRQQSQPQDPYASNWLERLRQIKRLKAKVISSTDKQNLSDIMV